MPTKHRDNILIYDQECLFCSNYVRLLRLEEAIGPISLVSARDVIALEGLELQPVTLNAGIALLLEGHRYVGADAMSHLALLSTSNRTFNRINRAIFSWPHLTRFIYPMLKLGRLTYLALVGKQQIH